MENVRINQLIKENFSNSISFILLLTAASLMHIMSNGVFISHILCVLSVVEFSIHSVARLLWHATGKHTGTFHKYIFRIYTFPLCLSLAITSSPSCLSLHLFVRIYRDDDSINTKNGKIVMSRIFTFIYAWIFK